MNRRVYFVFLFWDIDCNVHSSNSMHMQVASVVVTVFLYKTLHTFHTMPHPVVKMFTWELQGKPVTKFWNFVVMNQYPILKRVILTAFNRTVTTFGSRRLIIL